MTAIPALLPASSQATQLPYLTPAQFTAYPTWLDLDNLVPDGLASLQTDALSDVLLTASVWADSVLDGMRLGAHLVSGETLSTRALNGRVRLHPRDIPVSSVISVDYGWDPDNLTALNLAQVPLRNDGHGRWLTFRPQGAQSLAGPGRLGWGGHGGDRMIYVTWSYVAGFPSTTLSASCDPAANSIELADPTSVMPGQVLRIFDEGQSEAGATDVLTVASSYVPQVPTVPPTATAIPLAGGGTTFAHGEGVGVTGMPRDALQAVVVYTVSLLMREDVAAEEPPSEFGPAARTTGAAREGGAASGLLNDAIGWLEKYRNVWRP